MDPLLKATKLFVPFAGVLLSAQILAQGQLPRINGLRWRNVGPNRGGRSLAVAGSVRRPLEYFFGATGGGLWKTTDGGTTWHAVTDGQIHSSSIGAVAVSESNPEVVYIGTGETELRASIIQGDGVYRSSDGGKTWLHVGLADAQAIARVQIDPHNPDLVYVAALGHPFGPNQQRGIFRSRDGGKTWERILYRNDHVGAIDLCIDPHEPNTMFASLWEVYRKPWALSSGGDGSGLFKSTDGGEHWREITRNPGMPRGLLGKINVSVSGADSRRVYANVEATDGGLFRSDDGGETWARVNDDHNIRQRAFYFNRVQTDPKNLDVVYAMNVNLYRSSDGGRTLVEVHDPHADHHDLWIAADDPARMIVANDGGASVSVDGGTTWTAEHYPTAQFYHVATTPDVPYDICGAQQDQGSACVPNNTTGQLLPAGDWFYSAAGGEAGYVAPDPNQLGVFYAGDQAGMVTRYDRKTNQKRNVQVNPWMFSGMPARDLPERWQWVFPIVFSPIKPNVLFTSSQHVWKTTNGGQSWERISPDLSRAEPDTLGDTGGPITHDENGPEIYGTIYTIAPSRLDANTIWTGSDDGLVHITHDGGHHWQNVTPSDLPRYARVSLIEASPHKSGTAYLAANRYEMDDRQPYVFRTDDYGKTWTEIVEGIPSNDFARAIREDPKRQGLLYLGTEHGVYISLDNGSHWESLQLNLPDTEVPDLVVQGNDLVIATHGRSFYVLDGVGALRQLTSSGATRDVQLFQPDMAIRSMQPAYIDYFLKRPTDDLTIKIFDSAGNNIVQTFSSSKRSSDAGATQTETTFGVPSSPAPTGPEGTPGLNRFTWDLRYPSATVFPGMILRGGDTSGPVAVPGTYRVQLIVEGVSQTVPLVVTKDPRLASVTQADLQEQFDLAMKVRDSTSQANQMVIRIRQLKKEISARVRDRAGDPHIADTARALEAKLSEIEGELYQVRNRSPRDTLNYPIKLNNQLATLLSDIEMGDSRPTNQMYTVFGELSASLDKLRQRLNLAGTSDVAHFNDLLKTVRLAPVPEP